MNSSGTIGYSMLMIDAIAGLSVYFAALIFPMCLAKHRKFFLYSIALLSALLLLTLRIILPAMNSAQYLLLSLPVLFIIAGIAAKLQSDFSATISEYEEKRRLPLEAEIARMESENEENADHFIKLQNTFNSINRKFNFVKSFGSSLRFETAWLDIENGTRALLNTTPILHLPRLPGSIPSGFFPFVENGNELFSRREWVEAIGGERKESRELENNRLIWIPLFFGDGQKAVLHLNTDQNIDDDAVEIFATQLNLLLEKMRLYNEVELQSRTDLMTGLSHHAAFKEIFEEEVDRARRMERSVSLLMIDVDFFKQVNDTHGHLVGDQVLIHVAKNIRDMVRISDSVARYGGEEFAVILPETGIDGAKEIAERIRARIEDSPITVKTETEEKTIRKTISVGIASSPPISKNSVELISAADAALYCAKRSGRNRVEASENTK
ncbi:TPA: hypothetical protein DEF17_02680 [bacterium]|nr:MAG: hypothetical protein AUJ18_10620 [Candidatus Hydrogenedentes bacterium CG1_02_42_14]HBW46824.1 hypothetical protein [bacterium]